MAYNNVAVKVEEGIAVVTISRPKALNALNSETLSELADAVKSLERRIDVAALILTGDGEKAFVAGADIAEMKEMNPVQARVFSQLGHDAMAALETCTKPVIAAVNGFALGGGLELVLACDFAYASEQAKLGVPEVTLGIFPGFAGTQRLPRLIGKARAKELIFTGKMIDAQTALAWGIVNKVCAPESLMDEAKKTARLIAQNGPFSVSMAKEVVNSGYDRPTEEGEAIEVMAWANLFATLDQKEGMGAFLEKRKPTYQGR